MVNTFRCPTCGGRTLLEPAAGRHGLDRFCATCIGIGADDAPLCRWSGIVERSPRGTLSTVTDPPPTDWGKVRRTVFILPLLWLLVACTASPASPASLPPSPPPVPRPPVEWPSEPPEPPVDAGDWSSMVMGGGW